MDNYALWTSLIIFSLLILCCFTHFFGFVLKLGDLGWMKNGLLLSIFWGHTKWMRIENVYADYFLHFIHSTPHSKTCKLIEFILCVCVRVYVTIDVWRMYKATSHLKCKRWYDERQQQSFEEKLSFKIFITKLFTF